MRKPKTERLLEDVPTEKAFYFYTDIGCYTGKSASSLPSFAKALEEIEIASIEFHVGRGDFENWIRSLGDDALAKQVSDLGTKGLKGDDLRAALRKAVDRKLQSMQTKRKGR